MSHTIAIFPGSFDPFTRGHAALVDEALRTSSTGSSSASATTASRAGAADGREPQTAHRRPLRGNERVEARIYTGLTGEFAGGRCLRAIIRGVRNTTDFEYERTMEATNHRIYPDITTVMLFTPARRGRHRVATVREVLSFGRTVDEFMPEGIDITNTCNLRNI